MVPKRAEISDRQNESEKLEDVTGRLGRDGRDP